MRSSPTEEEEELNPYLLGAVDKRRLYGKPDVSHLLACGKERESRYGRKTK
jgi:hypothetical protein